MRSLGVVLVSVLCLAGRVGAQDSDRGARLDGLDRHHDCRIARLEVRVRRQVETGLYHLSALYLAADGRRLTQEACPDQQQPSWSISRPFVWDSTVDHAMDHFGYEELVRLDPGSVTVSITTEQGHFIGAPDPVLPRVVIRGERTFVAR
jgi:hypothetical protein